MSYFKRNFFTLFTTSIFLVSCTSQQSTYNTTSNSLDNSPSPVISQSILSQNVNSNMNINSPLSKEDDAITLIKKLRPNLDQPSYHFLVDNTFLSDEGDEMFSIQCYETIIDDPLTNTSHTSTIDWLSVNLTKGEVYGMFDDLPLADETTSPNIQLQLFGVSDDLKPIFEDNFYIIQDMFNAVLNADSNLPPGITNIYPNGNPNILDEALFQYDANENLVFLVFNYDANKNELVEGYLNGIPVVDILPGAYSLLEYNISDYFYKCKASLNEQNIPLPIIKRYIYVFLKPNGEYMTFSLNPSHRFDISVKLNENTEEILISQEALFNSSLRIPRPSKSLSGEYSLEYLLYQFYDAVDLLDN